MERNDEYFRRQVEKLDKQNRKKEREEKWNKRERSFFKAFLFTKDGKPKSSLLIYTFCLSFVFLAIYGVSLMTVVDWLEPLVRSWPPFLGNLLEVCISCTIGILVGAVLHNVLKDKRLVFGTHLWLALYAAAALITELIFLWGDAGLGQFLAFFAWFFIPPVLVGCLVFGRLYRRDYREDEQEEEKPWQKYLRR